MPFAIYLCIANTGSYKYAFKVMIHASFHFDTAILFHIYFEINFVIFSDLLIYRVAKHFIYECVFKYNYLNYPALHSFYQGMVCQQNCFYYFLKLRCSFFVKGKLAEPLLPPPPPSQQAEFNERYDF